jgi:urease accessory protein
MRRQLPIVENLEGSRRKATPALRSVALRSTGLAPLALVLLGTCDPALAHPGLEPTFAFASGAFALGLAHPCTGLDHLLALTAVGLWAGLTGGRALWLWPAAFLSAMLAGGALGFAGVFVPLIEPAILASVVVLGLLVATAVRLPLGLGAGLVALFAVVHGHAHGAELPAGAAAATYASGFALATALLHASGIAIGCLGRKGRGWLLVRSAGAAVAAAGVALAAI